MNRNEPFDVNDIDHALVNEMHQDFVKQYNRCVNEGKESEFTRALVVNLSWLLENDTEEERQTFLTRVGMMASCLKHIKSSSDRH